MQELKNTGFDRPWGVSVCVEESIVDAPMVAFIEVWLEQKSTTDSLLYDSTVSPCLGF